MSTVYPTGTTIYKPDECYKSYILLPSDKLDVNSNIAAERLQAIESEEVLLIDMNGNVVHKWKVSKRMNARDRLLPNGNLLHIEQKWGAAFHKTIRTNSPGKIIEYDWDGKVVWEWMAPGNPHHDVRRLPNGNTLVLVFEEVPPEILKKAEVKNLDIPYFGKLIRENIQVAGSAIYEVNSKGEIVWEYHEYTDLDLNRFSPVDSLSDWSHTNTCSIIPENKWYDAGDNRFKPGNIIISPRNQDQLYVIDKETKKAVWSWTGHFRGHLPNHAHEPEMIEKGLPGEGNIIYFDNGLFPRDEARTGKSMVIEINPITKAIVWKYQSDLKFFSATRGSQKKLPNGNVFISEDNMGRAFQVKPVKDHPEGGVIVWEYVHTTDISRAAPYPYDYCPQLKALPRPKEIPVSAPNNRDFHVAPAKQ
ncbi:MAG: aryl-sulfate sulfotransferase [Deltaproteobacteria bacterium]|nr:aryl-sulfate sulfotransferase [Deltaproteobacteria bacterium]